MIINNNALSLNPQGWYTGMFFYTTTASEPLADVVLCIREEIWSNKLHERCQGQDAGIAVTVTITMGLYQMCNVSCTMTTFL